MIDELARRNKQHAAVVSRRTLLFKRATLLLRGTANAPIEITEDEDGLDTPIDLTDSGSSVESPAEPRNDPDTPTTDHSDASLAHPSEVSDSRKKYQATVESDREDDNEANHDHSHKVTEYHARPEGDNGYATEARRNLRPRRAKTLNAEMESEDEDEIQGSSRPPNGKRSHNSIVNDGDNESDADAAYDPRARKRVKRKRGRRPRQPKPLKPPLYRAHLGPSTNLTGPALHASITAVDSGTINRIRNCFERAFHPNIPESEAKAALVLAHRMLAKHNISQAAVWASEASSTHQQYGGETDVYIRPTDGQQRQDSTAAVLRE